MKQIRAIRFGTAIDDNSIVGIITLTKNQHTIISPLDISNIQNNNWQVQEKNIKHKKTYYAKRNQHIGYKDDKRIMKEIRLHRLLTNPPEDLQVDHINGNTLDNRRSNLRIVTNRQNHQNRHHKKTSKYPGVYWHKTHRKWATTISVKNKSKHLGYFNSEVKAAIAYEKACSELNKDKSINKLAPHRKKISSKYKGVCWKKDIKKWQAYISVNSKQKHLGYFKNEIDAFNAHELAKKELQKSSA